MGRNVFEALHALLIAAALFYTLISTLPHENALSLAAEGKLAFTTVWGYRFRHADLLGTVQQPVLLLTLLKILGAKGLWSATILLQTLILWGRHRLLRGVFACLAAAAVVFAPALVFWSAALAGLVVLLRSLPGLLRRQSSAKAIVVSAAVALVTGGFIYSVLWLANPLHHVNRQRVLGGKSFRDGALTAETDQRLQLREACLAAINPDDLRAVSSLEKISLASLRQLPAVALIDLKVVEANYRLLSLRDEKGALVFSDMARAFAAAEKKHAENSMASILYAKQVCLIANFDVMPVTETAPFSRARQIYEARKKSGLETRIIQLPNP
ncbi:MAG: hypothetical protein U1F27_09595 [Turneriella sp.]